MTWLATGWEGRHLRWHEDLSLLALLVLRAAEFNQLRENQAHVASFVHDGGAAELAGHLGRRVIVLRVLGRRIELQATRPTGKGEVAFVEDGRPLKGRAMQDLASATVAELGVQWLMSFQRIRDSATLAASTPLDWAKLSGTLDVVWRAVLPFLVEQGVFGRIVGEGRRGQRGFGLENAHRSHDAAKRMLKGISIAKRNNPGIWSVLYGTLLGMMSVGDSCFGECKFAVVPGP